MKEEKRLESHMFIGKLFRWRLRFDVERVHVARWIDGERVPIRVVILAEKFTGEGFEEVVILIANEAQVGKIDAHTNRRAVRLRKQSNELEQEAKGDEKENAKQTNRSTIVHQWFTPYFDVTIELEKKDGAFVRLCRSIYLEDTSSHSTQWVLVDGDEILVQDDISCPTADGIQIDGENQRGSHNRPDGHLCS